MPSEPVRPATWLAITLLLVTFFGCGAESKPIPPSEAARKALDTVLRSWREGKSPNDLATSTPAIHVVDTDWASGKKLEGFDIGEEKTAEADRRFATKLTLVGEKAPIETVYIVVGTDSYSVFREADFERGMNMDNNPTAGKPKRR